MFKRLTDELPVYTKIWWGVLDFTVVTFIGCVISVFTPCSSMCTWFSLPRSVSLKNTISNKL